MAEHVIGVAIVLFRQIHLPSATRRASAGTSRPRPVFRMLRGRVYGRRRPRRRSGRRWPSGRPRWAWTSSPCAGGSDEPRPPCVSAVYPPSELARRARPADVLVLTAPLTEDTRGLIGTAELRQMRPDGVLINVAQGQAGARGRTGGGTLARHHRRGGARRVRARAAVAGQPLWDLPNVVITPHTSAFRDDYWTLAVDLFASNLRRFERGETLANVVDKDAGY